MTTSPATIATTSKDEWTNQTRGEARMSGATGLMSNWADEQLGCASGMSNWDATGMSNWDERGPGMMLRGGC
eukprot:1190626-Prorocentrum_minimum.AAC.1